MLAISWLGGLALAASAPLGVVRTPIAAAPLLARRALSPRASVDAELAVAVSSAVVDATPTATRAHVSHILVDTEELALLVAEKLDQGSDFALTALTISTCDSAESGGELGWITPGMYVPEFDAVAFNSAAGETVVADSSFGWHVIRVHETSTLPLEMSPLELKARLAPGGAPLQLVDIRDLDELELAPLLDARFLSLPYTKWQEWAPLAQAGEVAGLALDRETVRADRADLAISEPQPSLT